MAEDNQAKWVGIRPVNPSENIPVDIKASTGAVKVEPKDAATYFKVLTKKLSPAIADLQAIEAIVSMWSTGGTTANDYVVSFDPPPAGKLWVITQLGVYGNYAWAYTGARIKKDTENHHFLAQVPSQNVVFWHGHFVMQNPEYLYIESRTFVQAATVRVSVRGHQVSIYT